MKIKKSLMISYLIIILVPIIVGAGLYNGINNYGKKVNMEYYLDSMAEFSKYERLLDEDKFYDFKNKDFSELETIDKNVEISLYNPYGYRTFTNKEDGGMRYTLDGLYSNLFKIDQSYNRTSIKKPIFRDDEIIGVYEISVIKDGVTEKINAMTRLAIVAYILSFFIALFFAEKFVNKKINKPIKLLIGNMNNFAKGRDVDIDYNSKDEIGELIGHFQDMKGEINRQQKSKEYMISAISHDMKTPLTSIKAYTEILENKYNGDDEYTDIILNKCDDMETMLDDLFTYTLLTSDYKLEFVEVDGQEFFEMLISGYEETCRKEGLRYESFVEVEGTYNFDTKQMVRLLDNLVSNGIRYSREDGKLIIVAVSDIRKLEGKIPQYYLNNIDFLENRLYLLVGNQGEGIEKDEIENIFDTFYKTDSSRNKMNNKGTGLGLSIVKRIVDRHGGNIEILSRPGEDIFFITSFVKVGEEEK